MTQSDDIETLENRIDELEQLVRSMLPNRRDVLKAGGAAALGAAAMSGSASAGTGQVGTIGSASSRVDVEAEDIDVSDTISTTDLNVSGTVTSSLDLDSNGITSLATLNGDNIVTVRDPADLNDSNTSQDYQVQKDGTDGQGVINFKTS